MLSNSLIVCRLASDPSLKNLRDSFPVAERIVNEMRAAQKPRLCDESQISFSITLQPKKNVDPIQPADVPSNDLICIKKFSAFGDFSIITLDF